MTPRIATRFLVISDTHGDELDLPTDPVDVAIHCGDLTEESKLDEFKASVQLLKRINAPLKLVIAGNHDFTMDIPMFKKKLAEIKPPLEDDLVQREYGAFGEARELFEGEEAISAGIRFLDEGTHRFELANGACLTVYASPYTASLSDWGFQYHPQEEHDWEVKPGVNVAITHSPPRGLLDYTDSKQRAGSPGLFGAIAHARPQMHCFGHIHEALGAKKVTWRNTISTPPSHFTDINNDESQVIENLLGIRPGKFDTREEIDDKAVKLEKYNKQRYCSAELPIQEGSQTLFVNAAVQGTEEYPLHLPWIVSIDLPGATKHEVPLDTHASAPTKREQSDEGSKHTHASAPTKRKQSDQGFKQADRPSKRARTP